MRQIRTFILRLLVDSQNDDLHGSVQGIHSEEIHSFKNPAEMMVLLKQLIKQVKPTGEPDNEVCKNH